MRSSLALAAWVCALAADTATIRELIRSGRFAEAIAACQSELRARPADPALLTLHGLALRGAGDLTGALASLRKAVAASPRSLAALQAEAQIEYDLNDPRARHTLETIVKIDPANATARAMLASVAFNAGDCAAALLHQSHAPPSPLSTWRTGVCSFQTAEWQQAAAAFSRLLILREHAPTRFNLALSHWRAGAHKATLAALAPLEDTDPSVASLRAAAQRASGDVPGALRTLQDAVQRFPQDEGLLVDIAVLCLDQNALDLGIRVLEAGLAAHPQSARLLTALGVFDVRAGRLTEAQSRFSQVARMAPESGFGQVGVAMAMLQLGLASDAVAHLRAQPAGAPMVRLTLARALLQQSPETATGRREAIALLTTILAGEPSNAAARSLLGKALAQQGDTAGAVTHLERALSADPADRAAANQLLILYRRTGNQPGVARMTKVLRAAMDKEKAEESAAERHRLLEAAPAP